MIPSTMNTTAFNFGIIDIIQMPFEIKSFCLKIHVFVFVISLFSIAWCPVTFSMTL